MTEESVPNVVSMKGEPIFVGTPDPDVVRELEDWLQRAQAGEIQGVAIAAYYRDEGSGSRWGGTVSRSLAGQCFALAQRITNKLDE